MDTSEEYINMCQKARHELLANWKAASGDYVYSDLKKEVRVLYFSEHHGNPPEEYTAGLFSMWLPMQDQLQKIISDFFFYDVQQHRPEPTTLVFTLQNYIRTAGLRISLEIQHWSMEKLWLGYLMNEKYNKVWNGKDWVSV